MSGYRDIVQDWDPVIIRSSKNAQKSKQTHQNPEGTKEFIKLNENDIPCLNKMTREQSQELQQARNAKGWTQKQLASSLMINISIVQKYENCSVENFQPKLYKKMMARLGVKK